MYSKSRGIGSSSSKSKGNKSSMTSNNAVMFSAALQDHLMKKGNFKIDCQLLGPKQVGTKFPAINKKAKSNKDIMALKAETQITSMMEKEKKSILPYQSETLKKLKEAKSDQQKMIKYNKQLTWAQKLGIVQKPPLPMTAADWAVIEQKSKKRNDSESICSICLEDFKIEPQVILSCSHVFHNKCLSSFEKHNQTHCCPICRKRDYEKKVIDEAIRIFTMKSIIRIQRVFRGSRDRIGIYGGLVKEGYVAKSKLFNRRMIGFKMWRLSNRIKEKMKKDQKQFDEALEKLQKEHKKQTDQILEDMVKVQRQKILNEGAIEIYLQKFGIKTQFRAGQSIIQQKKTDWDSVMKKGIERAEDQCSICLTSLWTKPVYLLSCTHTFHVNCIEGFERYGLPGSKNKCPCCRSEYEKKVVQRKK